MRLCVRLCVTFVCVPSECARVRICTYACTSVSVCVRVRVFVRVCVSVCVSGASLYL